MLPERASPLSVLPFSPSPSPSPAVQCLPSQSWRAGGVYRLCRPPFSTPSSQQPSRSNHRNHAGRCTFILFGCGHMRDACVKERVAGHGPALPCRGRQHYVSFLLEVRAVRNAPPMTRNANCKLRYFEARARAPPPPSHVTRRARAFLASISYCGKRAWYKGPSIMNRPPFSLF